LISHEKDNDNNSEEDETDEEEINEAEDPEFEEKFKQQYILGSGNESFFTNTIEWSVFVF
jgi:hypothetical protein